MVKLVDTLDSKSSTMIGVPVQVRVRVREGSEILILELWLTHLNNEKVV